MTNETRFLIDSIVEQMTSFLIEDNKLSISEALSLIYSSQLYEKMLDLDTGLYYHSASYNYELLQRELKYGKIA